MKKRKKKCDCIWGIKDSYTALKKDGIKGYEELYDIRSGFHLFNYCPKCGRKL